MQFDFYTTISNISDLNGPKWFFLTIPEIALGICILLVLITSTTFEFKKVIQAQQKTILLSKCIMWIFTIILSYYILLLVILGGRSYIMHNYLFIVDTYTLVFKIMILFTSIIILWFSLAFIKTTAATNIIEFPIVLACATLSMLLFISSFDLMSMYITLEALSLALYTLAATDYTSEASIESGVKYFAIGAISSALLIYGISLFYGVFIVTDFLHIFKKLYLLSWWNKISSNTLMLHVALLGILIGFFFKISAFPCHFWTPDVYEGCPLPVTAFFAITVKLTILGFLFRIFSYILTYVFFNFTYLFYFTAVASMFLGCFCAFLTQKIKRFIAYSTINHIGYILVGLTINTFNGVQAAIIYLFIYVITNLIFFYIITNINNSGNFIYINYWSDLIKLYRFDTGKFLLMSLTLLSMAGVPPLMGFWGKYFILVATMSAKFYILTYITIFISTISNFYYIAILLTSWNKLSVLQVLTYFYWKTNPYYFWVYLLFLTMQLLIFCNLDLFFDCFAKITYSCKYIRVSGCEAATHFRK